MQRRFQDLPALSSTGLTSLYIRTMLAYLLAMGGLWLLGLEGIYGHPTPFYALYYPAVDSLATLAWQLPPIIVAGLGFLAMRRYVLPYLRDDDILARGDVWRLLVGIFIFASLFAATIAMIRGGMDGIVQAYDRQAYEYFLPGIQKSTNTCPCTPRSIPQGPLPCCGSCPMWS